jgi:hypothetical protein
LSLLANVRVPVFGFLLDEFRHQFPALFILQHYDFDPLLEVVFATNKGLVLPFAPMSTPPCPDGNQF